MNEILEDLPSDLENPFFTQFRYSKVSGIGREEGGRGKRDERITGDECQGRQRGEGGALWRLLRACG